MEHGLRHDPKKRTSGDWGCMMRNVKVGTFLFLTLGWTASVQADVLLEQVIAGAKADKAISWRVDRINTDLNDKGSVKETSLARFDGAAAPGARWKLLSVNGKTASKKASAEFSDKFNQNDFAPTYAQLANLLGTGAVKTAVTDTSATYRIARLPVGTVTAAGYDLSSGLEALVTVDKTGAAPFVSRVRISAPKPFKPASIGKVEKLERTMTFERGPNGLPVLTESVVDANFKVLVKSMSIRTHTAFQNQLPVIQTAALGAPVAASKR
jgi:hypothetical protein